MDTEVFGVSADNWPCHAAFQKSLNLPFALLSDWKREVSPIYGAWDETELTSTRKSFLIDKTGKVVFTQEAELTKPRDHAAMMKAIEDLSKKGGG
jgi:peroxiredoxin